MEDPAKFNRLNQEGQGRPHGSLGGREGVLSTTTMPFQLLRKEPVMVCYVQWYCVVQCDGQLWHEYVAVCPLGLGFAVDETRLTIAW